MQVYTKGMDPGMYMHLPLAAYTMPWQGHFIPTSTYQRVAISSWRFFLTAGHQASEAMQKQNSVLGRDLGVLQNPEQPHRIRLLQHPYVASGDALHFLGREITW